MPRDAVRINCAGYNCGAFAKDPGFLDGAAGYQSDPVVMSDDPRLAPPDVYRTVRWSSSEYDCLMTGKSRPYLLRLHFAESSREKVAGVCKFDVKVNGKVVLPDFDVAAAAGGINRAVAVDVELESDAQGHVRVEFAQGEKKGGEKHRDPRVCGIEVLDMGASASAASSRYAAPHGDVVKIWPEGKMPIVSTNQTYAPFMEFFRPEKATTDAFLLVGVRRVAASGAWKDAKTLRVRWFLVGGIQKGEFDVGVGK